MKRVSSRGACRSSSCADCYSKGMAFRRGILLLLCLSFSLPVQAQDGALRPKDVREMGKGGADAIPKLAALLINPDLEIRLEAVKQISEIGTQYSLDPLMQATHDSDAEIQIRATDGLVNFYLPGYLKTGFGSSLRRAGTSIKGQDVYKRQIEA